MSDAVAAVRPLRADEYEAFVERALDTYAGDMVAAGIDAQVARAKAAQDLPALLSNGLDTPGHFIYAIVDDGEPAGLLWLADRDGELGRSLFVYAVEVDEDAHEFRDCNARMCIIELDRRAKRQEIQVSISPEVALHQVLQRG